MTVTDPRYGSELVTATGKTFMFDSVECLAAYVEENPDVDVHSLWVPNFREPGSLMKVEEAFFVRGGQLKSPMSLNVAAFPAATAQPAVVADSTGGEPMNWPDVRRLVRTEWIDAPAGPGSMHGAHHGAQHGEDEM
jgi:copper chaperone NosL